MSSRSADEERGPRGGLPLMVGAVLLLTVLLAAGCSSAVQPRAGSEGQEANTITATGMATVLAAPDEAVLTVTVENEGQEAAPVADENSRQMEAVVDRLRQEGLPDEALETTAVNVYPMHEYPRDGGQPRLMGYRAQNTLRVTIDDTEQVGAIYAAVLEAGANNVMGPEWRLSDDSVAVQEALAKAVGVARGKADALAEAAGVSVGRVVSLREESASYPMYAYDRMATEEAMGDAVTEPPIEQAQLTVTASVDVVFQLDR
jgi:uncharacterized protein